MIRNQVVEFCRRARRRRRNDCFPGASVYDISDALGTVTEEVSKKTVTIVHAGTNEVCKGGLEELLDKYRKFSLQYRTKTPNMIISGVLPRMKALKYFFNKDLSLNSRLENLCRDLEVGYVNIWNNFYIEGIMFYKDGVNLSDISSARFGRLLNQALLEYRTKTKRRTGHPPPD